MMTSRAPWAVAGVVAGAAGLGTSYLVSAVLNQRLSPVTSVAELIIRITPGAVVEALISLVGTNDKPILVAGILVVVVGLFALIGTGSRDRRWLAPLAFLALAVVGSVAVLTSPGATPNDLLPIIVGLFTWLIASSVLAERLRALDKAQGGGGAFEPDPVRVAATRRTFLVVTGLVTAVAAVSGVVGRVAGGARRGVEQARDLLRLDEATAPVVPGGADLGVEGMSPWMTPASDFYLIDTAIVKPAIQPRDWSLRIHGDVEREIVLTYDELVARGLVEGWVTICCVSNVVGGDLIGNAWWSGVPLKDLIEEAGPLEGADAILQTSQDGWTCGTPLDAVLDGRNAMLAVAMNGQPLPIEHGFPVRTIVPGLYGYVSATKWVVDMEVTRFADISAYWTQRGWGEMGPIKMSSRFEALVPGGDGQVVLGGTAWAQHTGISKVEVSVDGGIWTETDLGASPTDDAWVQWRLEVDAGSGDHTAKVRATDKDGNLQIAALADVLPDGATGYHTVQFTA